MTKESEGTGVSHRRMECPVNIAIAKRWIDIFVLAVLGALLCLLLYDFLAWITIPLGDAIAPYHSVLRIAFIAAISGFAWFFLIQIGGFRLNDLYWFRSRTLRYPPIWMSIVLGTLLVIICRKYFFFGSPSEQHDLILMDIVPICLGIFFVPLWHLFCSRVKKGCRDKQSEEVCNNYDTVIDEEPVFSIWLKEEKPITKPEEDHFKYSQYARRICRYLLSHSIKSVGLLGDFGSGKTSVFNLVRYYLENPSALEQGFGQVQKNDLLPADKIILCSVEMWGFNKAAASRYILDCIVRELRKTLDTVAVSTVPERYTAAFSGDSIPFGKLLLSVSSIHESPDHLLKRINNICYCTGTRLVVFIEDIERNQSRHEWAM